MQARNLMQTKYEFVDPYTAMFYGGTTTYSTTYSNKVTRLNSNGTLKASDTTTGTGRQELAGANVNGTGIYYGGWISGAVTNKCTRIDPATGTIIGSETNFGAGKWQGAAAANGTNAIFFSGTNDIGSSVKTAIRVDTTGAQVGSDTTPTSQYLMWPGGAGVGTTCLYYGGCNTGYQVQSVVIRLDVNGSAIGSEISTGAAIWQESGTGF